MENIGMPSTWREMRYVITSALDKLGPEDSPWWSGTLQDVAVRMTEGDQRAAFMWDGRTLSTWDRAMKDLIELGIVTFSDTDGYRLAHWDNAH